MIVAKSPNDVQNARRTLKRARRAIVVGSEKACVRTAERAAPLIRQRTRRGVDAAGRPFAPYARSTRRKRARKGLPTSPVTLTETGDMLDRLKVTTIGRRGTAAGGGGRQFSARVVGGTARDRQLVRIHVSDEPRTKVPRRDFRGVTEQERALLETFAGADIAREVASADLVSNADLGSAGVQ